MTNFEFSALDQEIYDLRTTVMEQKQFGGYSAAIAPLRILHSKMLERGGYGAEDLMRLPLYLQQAGQFVEAIEITNDLLKLHQDQPVSISAIADKRRLMFQREKKYVEAIPDGITAYLFNLFGLYKSYEQQIENLNRFKDNDEFYDLGLNELLIENAKFCDQEIQTKQSREYIQDMLIKLLKKAKLLHMLDDLTILIEHHITGIPDIGMLLLQQQIRQVLSR